MMTGHDTRRKIANRQSQIENPLRKKTRGIKRWSAMTKHGRKNAPKPQNMQISIFFGLLTRF